MTASEWNAKYPVGTPVRYRPMPKFPEEYVDTHTVGPAYDIKPHHACVMLHQRRGAVALGHLEALPLSSEQAPITTETSDDLPEHVAELH